VGEAIASGAYEPLDLGVPALRVNTTVAATPGTGPDGHAYDPSLARVIAFVEHIAGSRR
jgi:hypothetical protein